MYLCGAVLVSGRHLLTAAHCINNYRPQDLRVRLGEWDVHSDSEYLGDLELDITSITAHHNFQEGLLYNDIALLTVDRGVDFNQFPHISPACLPHPGSGGQRVGDRCWVSGWGKDSFGSRGAYQNILKEVSK